MVGEQTTVGKRELGVPNVLFAPSVIEDAPNLIRNGRLSQLSQLKHVHDGYTLFESERWNAVAHQQNISADDLDGPVGLAQFIEV